MKDTLYHVSHGSAMNKHRTASNKTTLVSQNPSTINEENVIIAPGQGEKSV